MKNNLIVTPDKLGYVLKEDYYPLWVAINHHKTHTNKNMTLKNHLYLKEILTDNSRFRCIMKSTQGGISECLIILAWTEARNGKVVFYVLPTDALKSRFVTNRFEKSMRLTQYYREQVSHGRSLDTLKKKDIIDNQSLKDIGLGTISFAGSKSDVPFVELPADIFLVDEADSCDPRRLEMGRERLGHSSNPQEWYVGNPTFIGSFLYEKFEMSSKGYWNIKADCGHWNKIHFFDHIVKQVGDFDYVIRDKDFEFGSGKDIRAICDTCGKSFNRFGPGTYVNEKKSHISGKQISRVFSGNSTLEEIVLQFSQAMENDYKMQRFYNSVLGESYTAEGSKVSAGLISKCIGDYYCPDKDKGPCIMGIDVGNVLHTRIDKLLPDKRRQVMHIGVHNSLEEIFSLAKLYNVQFGVIDALPEIRLARKFSHASKGFFRCFFGSDKSDSINIKEKTITVSRLMALDDMKEDIVRGVVIYPKNILQYEEYMSHIQEPTRVWNDEKKVYEWVSNRDDHFFFSDVYLKLAEKIFKFIS